MGRVKFTKEEIEILSKNKYVEKVTGYSVKYTDEFIARFIREYNEGRKPNEIFLRAGFDTALLGNKRIERCSARWRKSHPPTKEEI